MIHKVEGIEQRGYPVRLLRLNQGSLPSMGIAVDISTDAFAEASKLTHEVRT